MQRKIDWSLYLVTDRELSLGRSLEEIVSAAVSGGVSVVQLREKSISTRDFISLAKRIKAIIKDKNIPLIINDRVDVALACEADGVHLGQEDMPVDIARKVLGKESIIGLSVENMEQVKAAEKLAVDYLGVSPIFKTPTKTDTKGEWGLDGLRQIRQFSRHPLIAIGGINSANVQEVVRAGAHGIAVVSAICSAKDPKNSAANLRALIEAARENFNEE
jgi:thiamine-phosphate pyrophosphorylase